MRERVGPNLPRRMVIFAPSSNLCLFLRVMTRPKGKPDINWTLRRVFGKAEFRSVGFEPLRGKNRR